jgi:hypothetical protein
MRSYYRTGEGTGFSLGFFGTVVFGPFYLMGWVLTLPFRLGRPRQEPIPVVIVNRRYPQE